MADYQQNFLNALQGGMQIGQQIKGIQDQRQLNQLAGQAYGTPRDQRQSLLGQLATISPQAAAAQRKQWSADDEADQQELVNMARFIKAAPPEQQAAAYSSILPKLRERGMQAPDWTPETQQTILQTVDALVSAYGGGQGGYGLKSLREGEDGFYYAIQGDQLVNTGVKVPARNKILEGEGGYFGVDERTLRGAPVTLGGASDVTNPVTGTNFGIKETNDYVQSILSKAGNIDPNATPEQQAEALLPFLIQQESGGDPNAVSPKGARGLTQVMPATGQDPGFGVQPLRDNTPQENVRFGRDYLTAMLRRYPGRVDLALAAYNAGPGVADRFAAPTAQAGQGQQLRPAPKAATVPAGYAVNPDGTMTAIPGGPADVARQAREDAAAARKAAEDVRAAQKAQESQQRQMESAQTAQDLIGAIDQLTASPGFDALGTTWGDAQIMTPFVRNDAKDAQGQLKTIASQVAMSTLARLKSLSATGATGFGALSNQELALIQSAISNLQSEDISNAELRRSLKTIRDKMEKVAGWQPAQGGYQIGQVIEANGKRYRITGLDDPNDPDVEEVR